MKIIEVYEYYGMNWSRMTRSLGIGVNTPVYWRKIGYIPYPSQVLIERETGGALVAKREHDLSKRKYPEN